MVNILVIDNMRETLGEFASSRGMGYGFDGWSEEAAMEFVRVLAHYLDYHGYNVQQVIELGLALAHEDGVNINEKFRSN